MDEPTRRERDVLDILYRAEEATAEGVRKALRISNSATRTLLARLEEKGRVERVREGRRFIYRAVPRVDTAARDEADRLLEVFFRRSPRAAVLTMMDAARDRMSETEWASLLDEVRQARAEKKES